jgi:hypothetical protein
MIPDPALEMDNCTPIERQAWRSEGTEANISMSSMVLGPRLIVLQESASTHWRLQVATSHRLIAFAAEGLPLDRRVTLKCGIQDDPKVHLHRKP